MRGVIFDIQHFSVHDGPGIRTTVFLKGCQIRCLWCHNPEGLSLRPHELSFTPSKCILCHQCAAVCPNHAHAFDEGRHTMRRDACIHCGKCTQSCPTHALIFCGREIEAQEVIDEVIKDRAYYRDNGGLTISGGEPMMQREFVYELIQLAHSENIPVALETNLCYDYSCLDGIRQEVDLFLADWKESNPELHRRYTGMSNEHVLDNLQRLHADGAKLLLRCPIIPGYNDREDHLKTIARLTRELPDFLGAEILPYHNLGVSKVDRFGLKDEFDAIALESPSTDTVKQWIDYVRSQGGRLINED